MEKSSLVAIESPGLTACVDLALGANIVSLRDPSGTEWFAEGGAATPPGDLDADFCDAGLRGYHDCFPTTARIPDAVGGFEAPVPDHGLVWQHPWRIVSDERRATTHLLAVATSIPGIEGLELRRVMTCTHDTFRIDVEVSNDSGRDIAYLWAGHGLLAVDEATRLVIDPGSVVDIEFSSDAGQIGRQRRLDELWPTSDGVLRWRDVAEATFNKVFGPWPRQPVALERGTGRLEVTASADVGLGLWWNKWGFPAGDPHAHLAIEPTAGGSTDSLETAMRHRSAVRVEAGATSAHWMAYTVTPRG